MAVDEALRQQVMGQAQGALALQVAFVGVANGLLSALAGGPLDAPALAAAAGVDPGYVVRWCDAAYAFGLLDAGGDAFALTALGDAFRPEVPGTLMPFAVNAALAGHMAERAAVLMRTGERPGEQVLAERAGILPLFGPMMEATFGPFFERHVLPALPIFRRIDARGGLAVDLGCGNGWYLRRLARGCPHLRGIGLDGFEESIAQAAAAAAREGLGDRLAFRQGDLHHFTVDEPVDLIAMNRALHHVWGDEEAARRNVFRILADHLAPGGAAVLWEPAWPADRAALRDPALRGLAWQNLAEHVQGNRFLRPDEIAAELRRVGLEPEIHLFAEGREAVVVGTRPG